MTRPLTIVTYRAHAHALSLLEEACEVVTNGADEPLSRDELAERAARASALLVSMPDVIDAALLERCPHLRIIAGAFRGADNLDIDECSARGVWVTAIPDLLAGPTAELAVALLLAAARRLREGDLLVRGGHYRGWSPRLYGMGLHGTQVGLVGMGAVGREIARRLEPFGCQLAHHDPAVHAEGIPALSLTDLLSQSRVLVVAAPLTPGTVGLIDAPQIQLLPKGSVLVNVGRGSTVDESAVADALSTGHLAAYAADVFAIEDLSRDDRPAQIHPALLAHPRSVFTPHLGSAIGEVRREIDLRAAHSIIQALSGMHPDGAINHPRDTHEAPRNSSTSAS